MPLPPLQNEPVQPTPRRMDQQKEPAPPKRQRHDAGNRRQRHQFRWPPFCVAPTCHHAIRCRRLHHAVQHGLLFVAPEQGDIAPAQLPVGVISAGVGVPLFLALLLRKHA